MSRAKQNVRAKAAGGYSVMKPIIKNKSADVYYRKAIEAETDRTKPLSVTCGEELLMLTKKINGSSVLDIVYVLFLNN